MKDCRRQIILDYAKWTALSALRSGTPAGFKARKDVYPQLDKIAFSDVLSSHRAISASEFNAWHERERADLDWPTTRPHEWDTRTSASQIRCSTSAATRTRILPSSNSPRSRQRWVRHQVLSQESASMSLSPLGSRAALVYELVDIHVRNRG